MCAALLLLGAGLGGGWRARPAAEPGQRGGPVAAEETGWLPTGTAHAGRESLQAVGLASDAYPASTEHSRASLWSLFSHEDESEVPNEEPNSPIVPRNLFSSGSEDGASDGARVSDEGSEDAEDAAPGSQAAISAEGYTDDTYMLTIYLLSLLAMLAATSKWLKQEVNAAKLLAFTAAHSARKRPSTLEATLDGVRIPTQQEFRQLGVGVRTVPQRGTGPLLRKRIAEGKAALRKTRTIPGGFDRKATVAAVMIVAATLFEVELADVAPREVNSLESAIMAASWGPSRPCRAKEVVFALLLPGHTVAIHGGSVQEDVLACTHCAHPGHCPNHHASHLGASRETQGYRPAGSRPA